MAFLYHGLEISNITFNRRLVLEALQQSGLHVEGKVFRSRGSGVKGGYVHVYFHGNKSRAIAEAALSGIQVGQHAPLTVRILDREFRCASARRTSNAKPTSRKIRDILLHLVNRDERRTSAGMTQQTSAYSLNTALRLEMAQSPQTDGATKLKETKNLGRRKALLQKSREKLLPTIKEVVSDVETKEDLPVPESHIKEEVAEVQPQKDLTLSKPRDKKLSKINKKEAGTKSQKHVSVPKSRKKTLPIVKEEEAEDLASGLESLPDLAKPLTRRPKVNTGRRSKDPTTKRLEMRPTKKAPAQFEPAKRPRHASARANSATTGRKILGPTPATRSVSEKPHLPRAGPAAERKSSRITKEPKRADGDMQLWPSKRHRDVVDLGQ